MKNRVAEIRKLRGLTQDKLAELVGITKQQIWNLEKGRRKLHQEWLIKIAKALNCNIEDLLDKSDAENIKYNDEFAFLSEEEKNLIRTFRKIKENEEVQKTKIG